MEGRTKFRVVLSGRGRLVESSTKWMGELSLG